MILMEYDLDIVHRPGRDLCFADLMTRAEFEHDEVVKKQLLHDMLRDRAEDNITEEDKAKQETMAQTQLRQNLKGSLQRADIQVHEDSDYESVDEGDHSHPDPAGVPANPAEKSPDTEHDKAYEVDTNLTYWEGHLKSPAERALAGDADAYSNERLEEHMKLLTLGARMDGFDPDDSTTILQKVRQITDDMKSGTHIPKFGTPMYEDCKEDDPMLITSYEAVCGSLHCAPAISARPPGENADKSMPSMMEIKRAQTDDMHYQNVSKTLEKTPREYQDYELINSTLHYTAVYTDMESAPFKAKPIFIPPPPRNRVMAAVHSGLKVENQGLITTYQMMRSRFHWNGMFTQLRQFVKTM